MTRRFLAVAAAGVVSATFSSNCFAQQSPPPLPAPTVLPSAPYPVEPPRPVLPPIDPAPTVEPATKDDAPSTLFDPTRDYAIGGFGGMNVMYTRLAGEHSLLLCGEGAVIIDHALTFGGGGCANATHADASAFVDRSVNEPKLHIAYGGGIIRYHFLSRSVVNVAIGAMVGGGGVVIFKRDTYTGDYAKDHSEYSSEAVFVAEPQFGVYLNLTRWARVGISGGYRFVSNVETKNMTNSDLSGPTGGISLHAGWF